MDWNCWHEQGLCNLIWSNSACSNEIRCVGHSHQTFSIFDWCECDECSLDCAIMWEWNVPSEFDLWSYIGSLWIFQYSMQQNSNDNFGQSSHIIINLSIGGILNTIPDSTNHHGITTKDLKIHGLYHWKQILTNNVQNWKKFNLNKT